MRRDTLRIAPLLLVVASACVCQAAHAQATIDERADRALRGMGEYLGSADEFSFRAEVSYDEFVDSWDQEIQFGGVASISVRRPDGLHVAYEGDDRHSQLLFDGQTAVFHDLRTNLFARTEAPGEIDAALDRLFETYGYSVPISDLVYSDPYHALIDSALYGVVVGSKFIDGIEVDHLAFSGETLDWQIWIEKGSRPVPRQLAITYKEEPGAPQYRARFLDWDFQPRLSGHYFEFIPPADAGEMEFAPSKEEVNP